MEVFLSFLIYEMDWLYALSCIFYIIIPIFAWGTYRLAHRNWGRTKEFDANNNKENEINRFKTIFKPHFQKKYTLAKKVKEQGEFEPDNKDLMLEALIKLHEEKGCTTRSAIGQIIEDCDSLFRGENTNDSTNVQ